MSKGQFGKGYLIDDSVWFYVTAAKHRKLKGTIFSTTKDRGVTKYNIVTEDKRMIGDIPFSQIIEEENGHERRTLM